MHHRLISIDFFCYVFCVAASQLVHGQDTVLPNLSEVVNAKQDLWGEASMGQPNGASYEFFRDLLPPPRYVHADYRYYPIVLSAPQSLTKASLISNGSGLNLRGGSRSWKDNGTPFTFRVGPDEFQFGGLKDRVSEPVLANGYLPIVEIQYTHPSPVQSEGAVPLLQKKVNRPPEIYRLEAFASTEPALAEHGVVFVKFDLAQGASGYITVQLEDSQSLTFEKGVVKNADGQVLAVFDSTWTWERGRAHSRLVTGISSSAAIATKVLDPTVAPKLTAATYDEQRQVCSRTWSGILSRAMHVETSEPLVNNAWRNLLIQNYALMRGNRMHYSALNQYDALYESEGSDAALAALVWGCEADVRQMLDPLFEFQRKGLEYHNAGMKIVNLCRYYWQTRDVDSVEKLRPRWEKEARLLVQGLATENGLFPKERYCGDISTQVYNLNANAKAWRALRDLSAILSDIGATNEAVSYRKIAADFRQVVLAAIEKSLRRDTSPPFVPIALLDQEPAHDPITNVRIGSYWNIIIGYTIASGIFPPGSQEETWIPRYQEQHGGICMGMIRSGGAEFNFWSGEHRVNPLYGTRYTLDTLRRDDPERALVSFYGMLAQGLTRNTFIGGEGCTLQSVDAGGRFFYCPPNTAANAHVLSMLRYQLVQDWDLDDDGQPETLRLLFGTSRRWLENGRSIQVDRAPTAFGPVSVLARSEIETGRVVVDVKLPTRNRPKSTLLRVRIPEGFRVDTAAVGSKTLSVDAHGTIDITELTGNAMVLVQIRPL